jgi:membrane protein
MSWRAIRRLIKETVDEWNRDNVTQMAAALAYYTLFSIAPLLVIAVAVAGAVFGEEAARGEIVKQIQGLVGKGGAEAIEMALANTRGPNINSGIIASLISIAALLFGASGVFVQLQESLNAVWNIERNRDSGVKAIVRKRIFSFAMVVTIGFILMASLLVTTSLTAINNFASYLVPGFDVFWQVLNLGVSFVAIALLFALIYKYIPDITVAWRDVLVGASLTSLLFSIGKELLGLYLGNGSFGSTYGAAGSLVTFLAWIYYSVQIMLFGAEFTQVYARKYGSHRGVTNYAKPKSMKLK